MMIDRYSPSFQQSLMTWRFALTKSRGTLSDGVQVTQSYLESYCDARINCKCRRSNDVIDLVLRLCIYFVTLELVILPDQPIIGYVLCMSLINLGYFERLRPEFVNINLFYHLKVYKLLTQLWSI